MEEGFKVKLNEIEYRTIFLLRSSHHPVMTSYCSLLWESDMVPGGKH